jgi:formylglycine-generating enzyme required for sulfatase activity
MDPALQHLIDRLNQLSDQFQELRSGVLRAVQIADEDPEMALIRSRKVLEYVVRDVFVRRVGEPPGTRPLENLIQRLVKDGHFPPRLEAYTEIIRKLGNVGAHYFGERISAADVYQSLTQLMLILEWYFEVERPEAGVKLDLPHEPRPTKTEPQPEDVGRAGKPHVAVVPKGLRSFDANDYDFFLQLLPGPRDKNGLPESIRFWKHRIESTEDPSFTVGVIYGPSGCGKSSLVKAGLIPRLARRVIPVYVEATPEETEVRILNGLRRRVPGLPGDRDLTRTIAALCQGQGSNPERKVVLVLDQFEQWLHAHRTEKDTELARTLRQCDGDHVQCILMVRDDFWVSLTRFMVELSIEILQGQNTTLIDLFDPIHTRKVLAEFGRSYGRLPVPPEPLSKDEDDFLETAVKGLSQDGWVVPIRLSLFAEMVKGKPWTPATLKQVGGTEGVGVAFLDETFGSAALRPHLKAAQAVLKAFLPETGTDIKGQMRSHDDLIEAAGYGGRLREFHDLLRTLDGEARMITPTDPEGRESGSGDRSAQGGKYYQLTHDYLVPSLREWLTRTQRETRRGRAELRLAERCSLWSVKPENRHLPSVWEWATIRLMTRKQDWTEQQQKMMRQARRVQGLRGLGTAALVAALIALGLNIRERVAESNRATVAAGLVEQVLRASTAQVPGIVNAMKDYRRWVDPALKEALARAAKGSPEELHARLALLPSDGAQAGPLQDRMLTAGPDEVSVIRQFLEPHRKTLTPKLWEAVAKARPADDLILPAASALALFDPDSPSWAGSGAKVAGALVRVNPIHLGGWLKALRPVRTRLTVLLAAIFRDRQRPETERTLATTILADYASDDPGLLADPLMDAEPSAYSTLYPVAEPLKHQTTPLFLAEIRKTPRPDWEDAPLPLSWAAPAPALVRRVEAAEGSLGERFAYCQTMPLDALLTTVEDLRKSGYRPTRFRSYADGTVVRVAAVWTRDGRDWLCSSGLTADEVRRLDQTKQGENYLPVDVAGYIISNSDGQPAERFAALWVKRMRPEEKARVYVDVPPERHEPEQDKLKAEGFAPSTLQAVLGPDGQTKYSGVWVQSKGDWNLTWDQTETTLATNIASRTSTVLSDIAVSAPESRSGHTEALEPGQLDPRYAAVWSASSGREGISAHGFDPSAQRQQCREFETGGYRPVSISVARTTPDGPLVTASVWQRPVIQEADRDRLAERQARAAVALIRLGKAEAVWPLLRHSADPRLRSFLINWLNPLGADPKPLAAELDRLDPEARPTPAPGQQTMDAILFQPETSIRRALILTLGTYGTAGLSPGERQPLIGKLLEHYRNDPDAGIHGAAEWTLRQWNEHGKLKEMDAELRTARDRERGKRRWYVNSEGQTLAVIEGPVEFAMGSPPTEPDRSNVETLHRTRINRRFAIATKEVTVEQYQRFLELNAKSSRLAINKYSPEPDGPMNGITWYEAAAYCNWLSRQENLTECYEPTPEGEYAEGMKIVNDFLDRPGYRLPTESEWEYACRAGALTSRSFGGSVALLGTYAWYAQNSQEHARPCGRLQPNDLGLFDMLGNLYEWCQDPYESYPRGFHDDRGDNINKISLISDKPPRLLRGGSFYNRVGYVRSAGRGRNVPSNRNINNGFRPARTYP